MFRATDLRYLVNEHGQSVTLRTYTRGGYNLDTGTVSETLDQSYNVKCYFADYILSEIDGTDIVTGDRKAIINTVDTLGNAMPEPEEGNEIQGQGDNVRVVSVKKIYSAGSPMAYICQVRE